MPIRSAASCTGVRGVDGALLDRPRLRRRRGRRRLPSWTGPWVGCSNLVSRRVATTRMLCVAVGVVAAVAETDTRHRGELPLQRCSGEDSVEFASPARLAGHCGGRTRGANPPRVTARPSPHRNTATTPGAPAMPRTFATTTLRPQMPDCGRPISRSPRGGLPAGSGLVGSAVSESVSNWTPARILVDAPRIGDRRGVLHGEALSR
jgi:hypothetical protein